MPNVIKNGTCAKGIPFASGIGRAMALRFLQEGNTFHSFILSLRYLLQARNIEVIEVIPPALNTDLGGKGLHDFAPPVSDFIESIFAQLGQGKNELSFGFSEAMTKAGPEEIKGAFARMNP